jgi:abequosyltransferase
MKPLISFAIPTYNFGAFIGETINTIETHTNTLTEDQFEIVVLDGGSNDQTDEVMEELGSRYRNIRYIKNSGRGGIDKDLNSVAEAAQGEFIWLFSADDLLVPGWDTQLAPLLSGQSDIVLVPAVLCDFQMKPLRPNPIFTLHDDTDPITFDFTSDDSTLDHYLSNIATLEAMFSFMSAIVIKRSLWHSVPVREDYFGTCWAHCARLMPLFHSNLTITYLNRYLINKRGDNDSFMEHGFVNRIGIAVNGWERIINEFFDNSNHRQLLFSALRKDMPLLLFIYAKVTANAKDEVNKLDRMLDTLYKDIQLPFRKRLYFLIYKAMPTSRLLNRFIQPLMPHLKRLRHKLKSAFT